MKMILVVVMTFFCLTLIAENTSPDSVKYEIVEVKFVEDTLQAVINIPKNMHLVKQEDFVYLDIEETEGVTLEKTIWSKGDFVDELGLVNYKKKVILKRKALFTEEVKKKQLILKVFVGYQMCYDTYCEPPEEVEFGIILPPVEN